MKSFFTLGLVLLVGCSGDDGEGTEEASLAALEASLDTYASWDQVEEGIVPGFAVHGEHVQIWLNDVAWDTIDAAGGGDMAEGAILTKESYEDADGVTLLNISTMYRTADGWHYAQFTPEGELELEGFEIPGCHTCHSSGSQDGVFVTTW